ncbi:MAG: sigma-70 family RNA polymerase sigma factor [Solirubrobacteraceae bacterium]
MPLTALAPDQRAVVQLVLQRDRSYAQIAELLNISEDAVRARAHSGLSALAPDVELPADKLAQIADFLLGQQNGKPRQATRRLLRGSNGAREWAETVRAQLADVNGATLPELPDVKQEKPKETPAEAAASEGAIPAVTASDEARDDTLTPGSPVGDTPDAPAPRPRPLRDKPRTPAAAGPAAPGPTAVVAASSRLGGALLIGLGVLAIVVVVLVLFVFKGDDKSPSTSAAKATATPTASATPAPVGQIALKGANGSKGIGVMRLYTAQQQLAFTLEGTGVAPNQANEAYAVWFTSPGGASQRLGFAQPVTSDGKLGTTGPRTEDLAKFPRWLATFKQVVVSRESSGTAKKPGPVVLVGTLPSASG